MDLFNLSGRVALVTGGYGGIGLGMAEGLAAAGAAVMIAGRSRVKNKVAVAALRRTGATAETITADVAQETSCRAMVSTTVAALGRLDILINNAGIGIGKRPEELALAEWNGLLATNLTGAFVTAQAAYPEMKRQGGGKIINIGSMFSIFGGPFAAAYGASKGGIVQLTKSLATAWAADNIQVNAVLPGCIDTDLSRVAREREPVLHANVLRRTPAGRWGTPRDLAGTAVFLASAASDFVTGAAIPVDGGFAIQG
ncbi:MAG TPA: glucose 1-dehydrogenase [Stellaceae bacterium]|nr:glucose 1-dehydrogenase [Stellaceae bacterium]